MARCLPSTRSTAALLLLLIESSFGSVLPAQPSTEEPIAVTCSLVANQSRRGDSVSNNPGELHVSVCANLDSFTLSSRPKDSADPPADSSREVQSPKQLTVYASFLPDNSSVCIESFDVDDSKKHVSVDVAVASGIISWPVLIAICRAPVVGFENECKMSVILSPDGAGRNDFHKGSNKAVVRARVSSKNAAGTRYAAQLDYCNSKQPSAGPAAAANENPTMLTPNGPQWLNLIKGVGIVQRRLRRDLGESKMPEDDESRRIGTEELSTKFVDGSKAPFDLPDDGRRLVDVEDDDSIEWVKKASDSMRHRGVYGYPFGSSVTARLGIRNGNRGSEKRKWKNSGMQWIKRNFDNYDHYDEGNDNYEENGDEESPDDYDDAVQKDGYGDESKRKWSSSAMGWIKRKWGNAGMGWLKRNGDKRKWRNSNLQWVK